ncbi:hypothetical protein L873DRAFT_688313 [Choiromyces venosus 120613-1]|uniref:Uncharacterized protein n=1 Tax=Choiromyces venosus 120613-1 TaxID=1336337 RepID=A0A3N4JVD6_9PEZI|nr:hypothetical protein L873DRAFT_688313 [Choiromyces venosus 120613-1]
MSSSSSLVAFKAFFLSFIYHFFCELVPSCVASLPLVVILLVCLPLFMTFTLFADELLMEFVSGLPNATSEHLFEGFCVGLVYRIFVSPAPVPVPEIHTIPLSVVLENLNRVDAPPPAPVEVQATGILPASYPASFPPSFTPSPVRCVPERYRMVRMNCIPMFEEKL